MNVFYIPGIQSFEVEGIVNCFNPESIFKSSILVHA